MRLADDSSISLAKPAIQRLNRQHVLYQPYFFICAAKDQVSFKLRMYETMGINSNHSLNPPGSFVAGVCRNSGKREVKIENTNAPSGNGHFSYILTSSEDSHIVNNKKNLLKTVFCLLSCLL
jgi:hypothetical protein